MRLKHLILGLVLSSLFVFGDTSGEDQINEKNWPSLSHGSDLLTLQYVDLEFRLPRDMVGRIIVLGGGSNLAFTRSDESSEHVILFRTVDEFKATYELFRKKGFYEGLDIRDAESFFDALARTPREANAEALDTMRQVMQVEDSDYSKTSNGVFTVYRLISAQPAGQIVYILINGQETIYEIAGHISDDVFNTLMSGMALSSVH